jgi:hypothetical protein
MTSGDTIPGIFNISLRKYTASGRSVVARCGRYSLSQEPFVRLILLDCSSYIALTPRLEGVASTSGACIFLGYRLYLLLREDIEAAVTGNAQREEFRMHG